MMPLQTAAAATTRRMNIEHHMYVYGRELVRKITH